MRTSLDYMTFVACLFICLFTVDGDHYLCDHSYDRCLYDRCLFYRCLGHHLDVHSEYLDHGFYFCFVVLAAFDFYDFFLSFFCLGIVIWIYGVFSRGLLTSISTFVDSNFGVYYSGLLEPAFLLSSNLQSQVLAFVWRLRRELLCRWSSEALFLMIRLRIPYHFFQQTWQNQIPCIFQNLCISAQNSRQFLQICQTFLLTVPHCNHPVTRSP